MKHMIMTTMAAVAMSLATACSDDDNEIGYAQAETITLGQRSLTFASDGGQAQVEVSSSHEFSLYTSVDWLSVWPQGSNGTKATALITADSNSGDERRACVYVWSGGSRDSIVVTQEAPAKSPDEEIVCPISGYNLVWHDEFDGTRLSSDWTAAIGNGSNGWGNGEIQYYTDENATVADGRLTITLRKDGDQVTSSRLYAKVSTGWKYGYIEARIKLPVGRGTWPAFWMMPVNFTAWPADGEIDIMEHVGYDPGVVYSTIHCNKYNNGGTPTESAHTTVSTAQADFHTYAVEWTESRMTFYVDGNELLTYASDGSGRDQWPFDSAFYPILNIAWGGGWGGLQGVDEACLPATMEVDYLRVFQK